LNAHLDPPHDTVRSGRGRHLEGFAALLVDLRCRREVKGGVVAADLDRFDRLLPVAQQSRHHEQAKHGKCHKREVACRASAPEPI
jgi:hypothetical protein